MSTYEAQTDNMGGLQKIWPIAVSTITKFEQIYNQTINLFRVADGTELNPLYVIADSIKFKQEKKTTADGTYYDTKLECDAPCDRQELQEFIETLDSNHYILVCLDNNGKYKVIGTPDEPLNIEADLDTGQVESNLNAYRISFSRKLRYRSPFSSALPEIEDPH